MERGSPLQRTWRYADGAAPDWTAGWMAVRETIRATFGDLHGPFVQFTLHRMGQAVRA